MDRRIGESKSEKMNFEIGLLGGGVSILKIERERERELKIEG